MSKCHELHTWHLGNVILAEARLDMVSEYVGIVGYIGAEVGTSAHVQRKENDIDPKRLFR